eukprot:scaffold254515_cov34-Prasinocladus_malaysianus.AAC.1
MKLDSKPTQNAGWVESSFAQHMCTHRHRVAVVAMATINCCTWTLESTLVGRSLKTDDELDDKLIGSYYPQKARGTVFSFLAMSSNFKAMTNSSDIISCRCDAQASATGYYPIYQLINVVNTLPS